MARTLKNYTFIADRQPKRKAGRPSLYPWTEWADGQVWSLTQGTDFKTSVAGFRTTCSGYAKRNKMTVKMDTIGKTGLIVQFTKAKAKDTKTDLPKAIVTKKRARKAVSKRKTLKV